MSKSNQSSHKNFLGIDSKYMIGAGLACIFVFLVLTGINSLVPTVFGEPTSINSITPGDNNGGSKIQCGPNERIRMRCKMKTYSTPAKNNEKVYDSTTKTWQTVKTYWKIVRECVPAGCISTRKGFD